MADERYCRFATKLVFNGVTLVDGILSVSAIAMLVNPILRQNGLPVMALESLYAAQEKTHIHYDVTINDNFLAFELYALSGPVLALKQIGHSPSSA